MKKEAIATSEYSTAIKKLNIDNESIIANRERSAKVEDEINKIIEDQNEIKKQLLSTDLKADESRSLSLKLAEVDNQLAIKRNELTKEEYDAVEGLYTQKEEMIARYVVARELEIDQSDKLTAREKEVSKLYLQRMVIQEKIANAVQMIQAANRPGIDVAKQEELLKNLTGYTAELDNIDVKIDYAKDKQKHFWQAIQDYIREAKEAAESFGYTIGKVLVDQMESALAEFGKAVIYQNAETIRDIRKQRDDSFADTKEDYDNRRMELEDDLNNGKIQYTEYYKQLQELDEDYHKNIKDSQKQFEENMKNSLVTVSSLWEKFWKAMIDTAIQMMAQKAVAGLFSSVMSADNTTGTSTGWAAANAGGYSGINTLQTRMHEGGYIGDLVKSFHNGGLNTNEVLIKALKSEYVMRPQAVQSLGVNRLDYMNRTGQTPGTEIKIINIVDPSSIPTLSPDDVVNIISYDVAKRGQTYKTIVLNK